MSSIVPSPLSLRCETRDIAKARRRITDAYGDEVSWSAILNDVPDIQEQLVVCADALVAYQRRAELLCMSID
jgi:hypothetical protein